ncbi:MAG TPA: restriction endonuclease subunit S [Kiritimatiellia bacterium]|nr:restriction endonuclease subunit S [Kiritimatiellia bacterium]
MAGEWNEALLRDLLVTTKDGDWGKENPEDGYVPYHIIRGTDFPDVRVGDLSSVPQRYLPEHTVKRRTLEPDDILIETAGGTRDRPTGRTLLITEKVLSRFSGPVTCASFARFLRIDRAQADPRFVFWYLQHLYDKGEMSQHQVQHTGVARFQYTRFAETQNVPLPPLAEQKAIAAVLGALDDKIELNRRMNATLEAMARALFQSWFVDFDPVRAKLDGRKPVGLDPATAALFPDSFQDSQIGPVPKGWKVERFDAHITANRGLSYKGEGLRDDRTGLPMHNLNSVYEGGGYKHEGLKYYAGEYREKHLLEPGDMIVTNTEQGFDHLLIGHAAIVPRCYGSKGIYSHHIYRVRHKPTSPFSPHYLVELFNNRRWHYWISGFSNGTTINMLPMDALEIPMLVVPPTELVKKFTALAEAAHIQVEDNKQQSRTLATLRDTLLPKLLSGELSVGALEAQLESRP